MKYDRFFWCTTVRAILLGVVLLVLLYLLALPPDLLP